MNSLLEGLLWVLGAAAVGAALVLVQDARSRRRPRPEIDNEAVGFVFAIVGVLYAIVLAFVVLAEWEQLDQARRTSYNEASSLVQVYWVGHDLPGDRGARIVELCHDYATTVINDEWPRMAHRQPVGTRGWEILTDLRGEVAAIPAADNDQDHVGRAVDQVGQILTARQERLAAAAQGLPSVMWFVLIAGGLATISYGFLFGIPGRLSHMIMVVGLTSMVVLLWYAAFQLEYPFGRGVAVGHDAFDTAMTRFDAVR